VVTSSSPKINSSATRPPSATAICTKQNPHVREPVSPEEDIRPDPDDAALQPAPDATCGHVPLARTTGLLGQQGCRCAKQFCGF